VTRPLVVYDVFMFVAPGVAREQPSGLLAPRFDAPPGTTAATVRVIPTMALAVVRSSAEG